MSQKLHISGAGDRYGKIPAYTRKKQLNLAHSTAGSIAQNVYLMSAAPGYVKLL